MLDRLEAGNAWCFVGEVNEQVYTEQGVGLIVRVIGVSHSCEYCTVSFERARLVVDDEGNPPS